MKKTIMVSVVIALIIIVFSGWMISEGLGTFIDGFSTEACENVAIPPVGLSQQGVEPVEEIPEPENQPVNQTAKILAAGDIMFHIPQINAARNSDGSYDFKPPFKFIKEYVENADLAIANLETVTAGAQLGFSGYPRFNSPEAVLDAIANTGFDILVTSNNHSLDKGREGLINTIKAIEGRNIDHLGTSSGERSPYLLKEINGIRIAILSYTYGLNGLDSLLTDEERSRMVNLIDRQVILQDISLVKDEHPDMIFAYLHWGEEYHKSPSTEQRELAMFLAENGVDVILGTHPHVIQGFEEIRLNSGSTQVVYSMGNLISNQRYDTMGVAATEDGMMVELEVEKNHTSGFTLLKSIRIIPTWIYREWLGDSYSYRVIPVEKALEGSLDMELGPAVLERLRKSLANTTNSLNN